MLRAIETYVRLGLLGAKGVGVVIVQVKLNGPVFGGHFWGEGNRPTHRIGS